MIVTPIGGIIAAHSTMWKNMMGRDNEYKPNVQEKKPAPIVEYRNKNINRWAMKKPIVRRVA